MVSNGDDIVLKNRHCSVHIADAATRKGLGSGLLYYQETGDRFFVFTSAHVIRKCANIEIDLLIPIGPENDDYSVCRLTAPVSQAVYSPLEKIEDSIKPDVAVIELRKDDTLELKKTMYRAAEPERNQEVLALGYPGGWRFSIEDLLVSLDTMLGTIRVSVKSSPKFDIRINDAFVDHGCRVYELEGFSGAPVWTTEDDVAGLVNSAVGETGYRGRVNATKMRYIQSIMRDSFNIVLESSISGIPEEEIAEGNELIFDAALPAAEFARDESWLSQQLPIMRALIDDLKIERAIQLGEKLLEDDRYPACQDATKLLLMKHLAYCYDICAMNDKSEELERRMRGDGLITVHDDERWIQKLFMDQRYDELLEYTASIGEEDKSQKLAVFFHSMAEAFVLRKPPEETVGLYIDENERLRRPAKDADTESYYLQIIGHVYSQCYQLHEKAIRCLNRSYRIGAKPIVLENLGAVYYQLAIRDAIEGEKIILARINRKHLYKARLCFLIVLEKEDELCLREAVRRVGWHMFHTFSFLDDVYWIIKTYPYIDKWFEFKTPADRRNVEMRYAEIVARSGNIDTDCFSALTEQDRRFLKLGAMINETLNHFNGLVPGMAIDPGLEHILRSMIEDTKHAAALMDGDMAVSLYRSLILLYSKGIQMFGWSEQDAVREYSLHFENIGNKQLAEEISDIVFRGEHNYKECVEHFGKFYEGEATLANWSHLKMTHIYFGKLDAADEMYRDLLNNHREFYSDEPEYAFRAYLDFIRGFRQDAGKAIKYFLEGEAEFLDKSIAGFWESELMLVTSTFNDPSSFEELRQPFVDDGLIDTVENDQNLLIAYVLNLNGEKAEEIFSRIPRSEDRVLSMGEAFYTVWKKRVLPPFDEKWNGIVPEKIENAVSNYRVAARPSNQKRCSTLERLNIDRVCCLDTWTLYLLAENDKLDTLDSMDQVFIPHVTIKHILDELCSFPNLALHMALEHISTHDNIAIRSADFAHQLIVRGRVRYDEPACVVAMALEANGVAVIGDPNTGGELFNRFPSDIVFPTDVFELE